MERVCLDFQTILSDKYASIVEHLLDRYLASSRVHSTKWWTFMPQNQMLQLMYFLCNIPYHPHIAIDFFKKARPSNLLLSSAVLVAPPDTNVYPYCVYLYVHSTLFVLVRGTTISGDWGVNANAFLDKSRSFHAGFYDNAVRGIKSLSLLNNHKFDRVVFCGHSMGAATAAIMAYIYKSTHDVNVETMILSCPKFCASTSMRTQYQSMVPCHVHMYSLGDITPTVTIGACERPFKTANDIALCLPIAVAKQDAFDYALFIAKTLHGNFYCDTYLVGAYKDYKYLQRLCQVSSDKEELLTNAVPIYDNTGRGKELI